MQLSKFGKKITKYSGILELMDDLGKAMSKRDLAEEMFGTGAYIVIQQMLYTMKQMNKAEDEKSDRQDTP